MQCQGTLITMWNLFNLFWGTNFNHFYSRRNKRRYRSGTTQRHSTIQIILRVKTLNSVTSSTQRSQTSRQCNSYSYCNSTLEIWFPDLENLSLAFGNVKSRKTISTVIVFSTVTIKGASNLLTYDWGSKASAVQVCRFICRLTADNFMFAL